MSKPIILSFFLIKLAAAYLYVQLHVNVLNGGDLVTFIGESDILMSALKESPWLFVKLTFGQINYRPEPLELMPYIDKMGYWYDNSNYLIVRFNAIIGLISCGNWYVNVIFFSFLSFIGVIGIYRFFSDYFHDNWRYLLIAILFLVPSSIFWYSGLHKEALVIFAVGMILNNYRNIKIHRKKVTSFIFILVGLLLLYTARSYVFGAFFISFTALIFSDKFKKTKPIYVYGLTGFLYIVLALSISQLIPSFNPLMEMTIRQEHFLRSEGNTSFDIPILDKSVVSVIKNSPTAVLNIIRRPMITDCVKSNFWCFLAMIESYFLIFLICIGLYKIKWKSIGNNSSALFCLTYSLITLVIIGLIVNNSGAMVRYKSIVIPFLLFGIILGRNSTKKQVS